MSYALVTLENIPTDHPVRQFNTYWQANRGANGCLERRNFDPLAVHKIMPFIMILQAEATDDGMDFHYRLCGTGCVDLFGIDYTGKMLGDDLPPEATKTRREEFATVMASKQPVFSTTQLPIEDRDFIAVYRGVFPVCSRSETVDQIFVVFGTHDQAVSRTTAA